VDYAFRHRDPLSPTQVPSRNDRSIFAWLPEAPHAGRSGCHRLGAAASVVGAEMKVFSLSRPAARRASVSAALGFVGIAVFQVALSAGVPWGHAAWGGARAELSSAQRIGSGIAVAVWTAAALVVLGRGGLWGTASRRLRTLFGWGTWLLAAVSVLAALLNFASQSRWENVIFGPLALLLAIFCTLVARSAADGVRDAGRLPLSARRKTQS
jgi:hypothetical protein